MYPRAVGKNTEKSSSSSLTNYEPAIFVDVDGTLWPDKGPGSILHDIDLAALSIQISNLCNAISIYSVFAVSNQTCVARGLCTLDELKERVGEIEEYIRKSGVKFDFRYCIHHPEASDINYRIECSCRKPAPGLIQDISRDFSINLESSLFIGDRITDAQSASYAGIKRIFLIDNEKMFESNVFPINHEYAYTSVPFRVISSIAFLVNYIRHYGVQLL